jgi:CheY-like chemotaxis protein
MALIAVINDDSAFLHLMHDLLEDEGYDVRLHHEGSDAHVVVKDESPDLIILDIRMEHPDTGWKLLELIRLDPATRDIPVIVCSADSVALQSKEAALAEQNCLALEKPFDLDALLSLVHQLIGRPSLSLEADA